MHKLQKRGPWQFDTLMHQLKLFLGTDCSIRSLPLHAHTHAYIKNKLYKREKYYICMYVIQLFFYFSFSMNVHVVLHLQQCTILYTRIFVFWCERLYHAIHLSIGRKVKPNLVWDLLSRLHRTSKMRCDAILACGAAEEQGSRDLNFFVRSHHSHAAKRRWGSADTC